MMTLPTPWESPVFEELKKHVDVEHQAPLKVVAHEGWRDVLRVILMNWGVSTQSYAYQVFMASYLINILSVNSRFIPQVLLLGSCCAAVAAFATGAMSDRFGRRPMTLAITGLLTLTPFIAFPLLNTRNEIIIAAVIIFGFVFAAQGITAVHMSYFPELFGSRYRYAGVTLGREFSAIIGGGIAPLLAAALLGWFANSWVPVAIYLAVTMGVSFYGSTRAPETLNRDLNELTDARPGEARFKTSTGWVSSKVAQR